MSLMPRSLIETLDALPGYSKETPHDHWILHGFSVKPAACGAKNSMLNLEAKRWACLDAQVIERSVIQVNLVCRDKELFAYLGPVGIFVLVEESRGRKSGGSFIELSDQVATKCHGSGQGGGGGKETAAVEQGLPPGDWKMGRAMLRLARGILKRECEDLANFPLPSR